MDGTSTRIARTVILAGAGVLLAGLRFFYIGERAGGAAGLVIGLALIAGGLLLTRRGKADASKLMAEGFCVDADFESAERPSYSARPSNHLYNEWYYTIKCSWRDPSGTGHIYTDRILLHFDPNFELTHRKTIKVYIDRDNPSVYYMDLEFLKELDKRRR